MFLVKFNISNPKEFSWRAFCLMTEDQWTDFQENWHNKRERYIGIVKSQGWDIKKIKNILNYITATKISDKETKLLKELFPGGVFNWIF